MPNFVEIGGGAHFCVLSCSYLMHLKSCGFASLVIRRSVSDIMFNLSIYQTQRHFGVYFRIGLSFLEVIGRPIGPMQGTLLTVRYTNAKLINYNTLICIYNKVAVGSLFHISVLVW